MNAEPVVRGQLWTTPSSHMGLSPPGPAGLAYDTEDVQAVKKRLRGRVIITAIVGREESTTKINGIAAYYVPSKEAYYIPSINYFYIPSVDTGTCTWPLRMDQGR
ncbi:uncharacterized protein LOC121390082 isoform X2 [Gigantopelta aegis]|uniref:uncharacterized protein LOC121390082 isoform X2 n=1 Tax=Gigantopelta aegis TaxID=1735272 RepID=UPI001B88BA53|nr:uncharacterized protein LOC121390082 isoform X2 [Gigantopelta aegis]